MAYLFKTQEYVPTYWDNITKEWVVERMSKTIKGSKGPGYEYWSKRNYKDMTRPGKTAKQITKRVERRKVKENIKKVEK